LTTTIEMLIALLSNNSDTMAPRDPSQPSSSSSFPSDRGNNINNDNANGSNNPTVRGGDSSEEAAIYRTFMLVIRNKFMDTPSSPSHEGGSNNNTAEASARAKRLDEIYNSSAYAAEKNLLTGISNNGMVKGLCFGLGTFVFLRAGPKMMTRFLTRRFQNNNNHSNYNGTNGSGNVGGGYQFDIRNAAKGSSSGGGGASQHIDPAIPRPGLFLRTIKFGLDAFVSISAAMYGSVYFTDTKRLMKEVSDIPLVSGRSLVSDELCDDFIDVYRAIPKKVWNKYDGQSESLDCITHFVKNCLRRQKVEREIVEDQKRFGSFGIMNDGSSESDSDGDVDVNRHVPIPPPGVSQDIQVEIPWLDKSDDIKVGRDPTGSFGEDESFESQYDFDWDDGEDTDTNASDSNDKEWK